MVGIWILFIIWLFAAIGAIISLIRLFWVKRKPSDKPTEVITAIVSILTLLFSWFAIKIPSPEIYPLDNEIPKNESVNITLVANKGLKIKYTLDGTDPKSGNNYIDSFNLNHSATVAARARFVLWWSDISKSNYTIETAPYTLDESNAGIYSVDHCEASPRYTYIRDSATNNGNIIFELRKHNIIEVKGTYSNDNSEWAYVEYCGICGWVNTEFLTKVQITENAVVNSLGYYYVSTDWANMRKSASEQAEKVQKVYYGQKYYVDRFQEGWGIIKNSPDDETILGYISMECMSLFQPGIYKINSVSESGLNFRSMPDEEDDTNIIDKIPNDTEINITKHENGWIEAIYKGVNGWVKMKDMKLI